MKEEIQKRIQMLREKMKEKGLQAYLVVSDDFHASEYVGDYFKCREFISGFDGSAGSVVVTADQAGLWTDGRYFLQAEEQLQGTGVDLYKMGEEGVPTIAEFLKSVLKDGDVLGFDGRTVSSSMFQTLRAKLGDGVRLSMKMDLVGDIWENRPAMSAEPVMELDVCYAGKSRSEKIADLRAGLAEKKADYTVIASLDDLAWLLNIRGNDVEYNPVVLSYALIGKDSFCYYVNESVLSAEVRASLEKDGITVCPYEDFYGDLEKIEKGNTVLVDSERVNACVMQSLPMGIYVLEEDNLTLVPKAKKNPVEVENERQAHIKDGVAVTRFIYWLKHHVGKEAMTELSVAEKLDSFRQMGEHYQGQSFAPIAGFREHGAIVHYEATEETALSIEPESFLLLDTGGQYLEGTTDITRTIALGEISQEAKTHYTAVLRGNLNLANAKFKYGCSGLNLDYLARSPLWEMGLDYNHGTGHGVGYFLNVHEGPQNIRYRMGKVKDNQIFEEGMITSDEPGLYLTNKYGIRLENLMVCKKAEKNEYGQFMNFETLTMVPFDLDAIDASQMTQGEKSLLNAYHKKVYETIAPYLPDEEKEWLKEQTKAVS